MIKDATAAHAQAADLLESIDVELPEVMMRCWRTTRTIADAASQVVPGNILYLGQAVELKSLQATSSSKRNPVPAPARKL
jgi:hypothetical protein